MLSDPLIVRWLIGALAVGWNGFRTWQYLRTNPNEFNTYMFWFYTLTTLGLIIWAIPILISDSDTTLFLAQLIGDVVLVAGISFSWLVANQLFFHGNRLVKHILFVVLPLYVALNGIISTITLSVNQPYFDADGFFVADRPDWYFVIYSLAFIPLIPLGAYLTFVTRHFPQFRQRLRSGTIGILMLIISITNILIPFGLSIEARNIIYLISFGFALITTLLFIILPRRDNNIRQSEETVQIVRG